VTPERFEVGAHRVLAAGTTGDVIARPPLQFLVEPALELGEREGEVGQLFVEPIQVDLGLVVAVVVDHVGRLTVTCIADCTGCT
jgi:hypothetical protein